MIMKKSKGIASLLLVLFLSSSLLTPAAAIDEPIVINEAQPADSNFVFSEMELYFRVKESSKNELLQQGYSTYQINEIQNFNLESAVYERAQLPEETLKNYGYTDVEISVLKAYTGEEITPNSLIAQAVDATMSGYFSSATHTTTEYQIRYVWAWDSVPFFVTNIGDEVGLSWVGINSNGMAFESQVQSRAATASYYNLADGSLDDIDDTLETDIDMHLITANFPNFKNTQDGTIWAKTGTITVELTPIGTARFYAVRAQGLYVHTTSDVNLNLSVSTNLEDIEISIAPSVTSSAVEMERSQALIFLSGNIDYE